MGFIRSGVVFIVSVLLFFTLFAGNLFLTFTWSLEDDNVQPYLHNITEKLVETNQERTKLLDLYEHMQIMCISYPGFSHEFENTKIVIPCEQINIGPKETIDYAIEIIPESFYYKEYNCSYWNCLEEGNKPIILLSKFSKDYWHNNFQIITVISIILILLSLLFSRDKHTPFVVSGILMIISSLLFKKINWFISLIPSFIPIEFVPAFFIDSYDVFILMSIIGLILIIFGASFAFFKWGMKINELFNKFIKKKNEKETKEEKTFTKEEVKKIIKEEIKKSKNKESLRQKIRNLIRKEKSKTKK